MWLGDGGAVMREAVVPCEVAAAWAEAVDAAWEAGELTPAALGRARVRDDDLRGDHTAWLSDLARPGALLAVHALFDAVRVEVNRGAWLGLVSHEVQVACYPGDGARYVRHRDAFRADPQRRLTAIVYLNAGWVLEHGGALRVWEPAGPREIAPAAGRLVLFLADRLDHAVLPTAVTRRAITAWYRSTPPLPAAAW